MDLLLVVLHAGFFAPIVWRLAKRVASRTATTHNSAVATQTVVAPHPRVILMFHGAGLVLLYVGLTVALMAGRLTRAVTVRAEIGALIIVAADTLMMWSFTVLEAWRLAPKIEAGDERCTTGPYEFVRHPMYLAVDLLGVGSAVWVPTPIVALAVVLLVLGGELRARAEERVLLQAFGNRYRDYVRRVPRILPRIY